MKALHLTEPTQENPLRFWYPWSDDMTKSEETDPSEKK